MILKSLGVVAKRMWDAEAAVVSIGGISKGAKLKRDADADGDEWMTVVGFASFVITANDDDVGQNKQAKDETISTNGDSTTANHHSADRTPPAESQNLSTAARANGMTISLDGLPSSIDPSKAFSRAYGSMKAASIISHHPPSSSSSSAPPTSHAHCPTCGKTVSDPLVIPIYSSPSSSSSPDVHLGSSPLVIPMGPLAAAAFESGMSAVEELKLLKAQVQDVARVCNAVARGDLSQKITVPVQGVVMVQLKDVINTMVSCRFFFFDVVVEADEG
jgi:osomolarity two-component system sensor histidine kinase NIK1